MTAVTTQVTAVKTIFFVVTVQSIFHTRGQLAELGPPDLRFTLKEMDEPLNGQLTLDLTNQELRTLPTSTLGWALGSDNNISTSIGGSDSTHSPKVKSKTKSNKKQQPDNPAAVHHVSLNSKRFIIAFSLLH